jgi:nucleoside-diphosphate-sugar epimerase
MAVLPLSAMRHLLGLRFPVRGTRNGFTLRLVATLVVGAAGMIGRKLTARLAGDVRLVDWVAAPAVEIADVAEPGVAARLVADRPELIFHLAAVVSGEAEADFEKGYRVNLDGTRSLLEAIRALDGYRPRLVFASSIAVFGAPFPDTIPDDFAASPLTSYGTQKAISELLLADYSRRGFVDAIGLRLPTITVRPGAPNLAASGFFSSIVREPLSGREAVLPVPDTVRHWHASPRSAVGFLLHAAELDTTPLGARRSLTMPGVSVTVAEQIEALRRAGGDEAVRLIRREPDETITRIVEGWPERFDARRAVDLGFRAETSFDEIVQAYVEDDLGG